MLALVDDGAEFVAEAFEFEACLAARRFGFEDGEPLAGCFHEAGPFADVAVDDIGARLLQTAQDCFSGKGAGVLLIDDVKPIQGAFGGHLLDGLHFGNGLRDAVRRPYVETGKPGRHQHQVAGQDDIARNAVTARRAVDHHAIIALRKFRQLVGDGAAAVCHDGEPLGAGPASLEAAGVPGHGAGLRIGINEKGFEAEGRHQDGDVQGEGGLACAAFLANETDEHAYLLSLCEQCAPISVESKKH